MKKRKSLGQNFLVDESVAQQIVEAVGPSKNQSILEIGPGRGVLTRGLLEQGHRVMALEIDPELCSGLIKEFGNDPNFSLIQGDAVKWDYSAIGPRFQVVSNLPYYAATHILKRLMSYPSRVINMIVMLQKEVVDRLVAIPGQRDYSSLTVFFQFHCSIERLLEVGKECFSPTPKIDSSVIRITPLEQPEVRVDNDKEFFKVVHAAFLHKRKILKNNLKPWKSFFVKENGKILLADIDLNRRGETLSIEEFATISNYLHGQNISES